VRIFRVCSSNVIQAFTAVRLKLAAVFITIVERRRRTREND